MMTTLPFIEKIGERALSMRNFSFIRSDGDGEGDLLLFDRVGGKIESLFDIFYFDVRVGFEDLLHAHSICYHGHYGGYRDSHVPNTGDTAHLVVTIVILVNLITVSYKCNIE
jgi:hypothetical protein